MSTRYVFTLFNYSDADIDKIKAIPHLYLVFGYEVCPTTERPHLQGFITMATVKRLAAMKKYHATAHWEKAKGTSIEASDYCKKDGNFFEDGTPPSQGKRTDLVESTTMLKQGQTVDEVAMAFPSVFVRYSRGLREFALMCQKPYDHFDTRGYWFVGKPGTGKSRFARTFEPYYLKDQNKWFDGYAGEETIILDDMDTNVLGHHIKIWSDRYSCRGETKGGTVCLRHHRFIVTSNFTIDVLFAESEEMRTAIKRRFVVRDFDLFPYRPPVSEVNFVPTKSVRLPSDQD